MYIYIYILHRQAGRFPVTEAMSNADPGDAFGAPERHRDSQLKRRSGGTPIFGIYGGLIMLNDDDGK